MPQNKMFVKQKMHFFEIIFRARVLEENTFQTGLGQETGKMP
jgi:hypothetical protein